MWVLRLIATTIGASAMLLFLIGAWAGYRIGHEGARREQYARGFSDGRRKAISQMGHRAAKK